MQFEKMGKKKSEKKGAGSAPAPAPAQKTDLPLAPAAGDGVTKPPREGLLSFLYKEDGTLDKKMLSLVSVLSSAIILLLVLITLALVLPGCKQEPPASTPLVTSGSASATSEGYDMTLNALPVERLQGTILEETEDAGEEYVEETLFLGDSNTVRLTEFSSITGVTLQNGIGVVGEGIQGAVSNRNIIFSGLNNVTMAQSVAIVQPRRVVITFGTNNAGYTPTDDFIEFYETFIDDIRDSYRYADIIIASVPPISQNHTNGNLSMTEIDKYNLALADLAKEEDCKFLNWSEVLRDEETGYAAAGTMEGDGIHITRKAAERMIDYFRTHSHITDDERPKPLDPVPNHIQTPAPVVSSTPPASSAGTG
ncbi:GDSL-type esterase/lipase family protein, partial [Ruminococcaceae bacterium OttesenSCG-928-I18]|nr:GDSL-type esterase/lipase family protein [Ruminococcaceae bacterium OttesenSCG-928-I18]